ncbi:VC2046/SO_2500 family protein [Parashewanella tropica]|uniref:VC2046/SO_2500 family protein n=1 Tax=Parashewanella tropica TaxID=2547970 RepID=UPI00105A0175|nr:VC2046/SO_2500 family protein [Parashewanella tropica]
MQLTPVIVNELDIGGQLNKATTSNYRSEFSLLLALMSQDVRSMAPHSESVEQPLIADISKEDTPIDHGSVFHQDGLIAFRLQHTLKPEALVNRGSRPFGLQQAIENCDIHVQQKHNVSKLPTKKLELNLVDQIQKQEQMLNIVI